MNYKKKIKCFVNKVVDKLFHKSVLEIERLRKFRADISDAISCKGADHDVVWSVKTAAKALHTRHAVTTEGDCEPWCEACGPSCKHGENSYECQKCIYG